MTVLLRCAPALVVVALAGACEVASVNVLDPLPSPAVTPEAGAFDASILHDAAPGDDSSADDGSPLEDAPFGEDALGAPEAGGCGLVAIGGSCIDSAGCCSGLCALDPTSKLTCRPANGCLGAGESCGVAGACCSLACVSTGTNRVCGSSPMCVTAGGTCSNASDCCANQCAGDHCVATSASCRPAGESCGGNGDCCSRVCASASDGQQRCALLQACRVLGEICAPGADCCSATCTFDANGVGHCAPLPACTANDGSGCTAQVDDVCGGNKDCCSRQCRPTSDGTSRCAPAGGCRTECELCGSNGDCCSGSCVSISDSISICEPSGTCGKDGEGCLGNPQCCAMGPGFGCIENPPAGGFHRCHSNPPSPDGGTADGTACELPGECKSGFCLPSNGVLTCAASCVADGSRCTDRADCCDPFADCMSERGGHVCAPLIH